MNPIWFKRLGVFYIPTHFAGYCITLLVILSLPPVYIAIARNNQSVGSDFLQLFLYTTCTAFWWKWIADKTSN